MDLKERFLKYVSYDTQSSETYFRNLSFKSMTISVYGLFLFFFQERVPFEIADQYEVHCQPRPYPFGWIRPQYLHDFST